MTKDSNNNELANGDNVSVIKDLKLKGSSSTIKRGTVVKNIKLTSKEGQVEAKLDKMGVVVLKSEFLKKV